MDPDSVFHQEHEPTPGQMITGGKMTSECSQFKLSVLEGGLDQLNKAKVIFNYNI